MPALLLPQRIPLVDMRTGLIAREWLRALETLTGTANGAAANVTNVVNEITQLVTQQGGTTETVEDLGTETLLRIALAEIAALRSEIDGLKAGWQI